MTTKKSSVILDKPFIGEIPQTKETTGEVPQYPDKGSGVYAGYSKQQAGSKWNLIPQTIFKQTRYAFNNNPPATVKRYTETFKGKILYVQQIFINHQNMLPDGAAFHFKNSSGSDFTGDKFSYTAYLGNTGNVLFSPMGLTFEEGLDIYSYDEISAASTAVLWIYGFLEEK